MLTDKQMAELISRSQDGEGVMKIIESMGLNPYVETDWLQQNRRDQVVAAKKEQLKRKADKAAKT